MVEISAEEPGFVKLTVTPLAKEKSYDVAVTTNLGLSVIACRQLADLLMSLLSQQNGAAIVRRDDRPEGYG